MKQNSTISVIDINSEQTLKTFELSEAALAYEYAAEMESYGLDVEVDAPTITETLANSLGLSANSKEDYEQSVIAELEDHEGSCCAKED